MNGLSLTQQREPFCPQKNGIPSVLRLYLDGNHLQKIKNTYEIGKLRVTPIKGRYYLLMINITLLKKSSEAIPKCLFNLIL